MVYPGALKVRAIDYRAACAIAATEELMFYDPSERRNGAFICAMNWRAAHPARGAAATALRDAKLETRPSAGAPPP